MAKAEISRRGVLMAGAAMAVAAGSARAAAGDPLGTLAADVANMEAVRAAKRLQHAWSHYAEAGDFAAMADLFARNGKLILPPETAVGRTAILALLRKTMAGGAATLGPDQTNVRLMIAPVVTVDPDGRTARGRWHEVAMTGTYGKGAAWAGGIHENVYVLEDGVWKIGTIDYHPEFAGPYETGWHNVTHDVPLTPFHYTPDGAGTPVPLNPRPLPTRASAAQLAGRAQALADESAVQNLLAAYGFYCDKRLWDDVADLFADDAVLAVPGSGEWKGKAAIRKLFDRFGPVGLQKGQLFDHLELVPMITVAPDGQSATARNFELQMAGEHGVSASWRFTVIDTRFAKAGGVWRIAGMTKSSRWWADYDKGWGKELKPLTSSYAALPLTTDYPKHKGPAVSFAHPVTHKAGAAPLFPGEGRGPVASGSMLGPGLRRGTAGTDALVREAQAALAIAKAHDGAENVSTAYGYYIDDFAWNETADLFATDGWKELSYVGTYIGRERIRQSLFARYNKSGRSPSGLAIHQKIQPYVTVAPGGRSARIRLKLWQFGSSPEGDANYIDGIYENQVKLENGVWKIHGMDLDYVFLASYPGGWATIAPGSSARFAPKPGDVKFPPDGPLRGAVFPPYPDIGPQGFHFVNPVSGRQPPLLLPFSDGRPA